MKIIGLTLFLVTIVFVFIAGISYLIDLLAGEISVKNVSYLLGSIALIYFQINMLITIYKR